MFDVGRSMFDVHQFLFRSDWPFFWQGGAYMKLHCEKYFTAEIAKIAEKIIRQITI